MTGCRALLSAGLLACLLTGLLTVSVSPARAAGYRYWSFWQRTSGSWSFAQEGPAATTPPDGDVEGWRFAVSADSGGAAHPRDDAAFGRICASSAPRPGMKRIALVLDFGTADDARPGATPPAEHTACAQVPAGASAADALAAVAKPLRYSASGMICAIAGYPQSGCGEEASGPVRSGASAAPAAAGRSRSGPSVGVLAGAAAVLALAAAGFWQARRRGRQS
ncbi:SCO2322 family protein [Streptomyces humicola]|uniref:SCO2322 family protein n=1 Tax=Streptomyces humicola TaxID=2953240 RepID=UPI003557478D